MTSPSNQIQKSILSFYNPLQKENGLEELHARSPGPDPLDSFSSLKPRTLEGRLYMSDYGVNQALAD